MIQTRANNEKSHRRADESSYAVSPATPLLDMIVSDDDAFDPIHTDSYVQHARRYECVVIEASKG